MSETRFHVSFEVSKKGGGSKREVYKEITKRVT